MSHDLLGICGFGVFLILILMRVPIGISLGLVGAVGLLILRGITASGVFSATMAYSFIASYSFSVIPMFILMGFIAFQGGITKDLFASARAWFGRIPGGLAVATIAGCAAFGAVCGTSLGGAAAMGKTALPEMERHGYQKGFAAAAVAAGGTLSALIPPSVGLVLYGIFTETSIEKLLIAGIIPGLSTAVMWIIMIMWRVKRNPSIVGGLIPPIPLGEKVKSLKLTSDMLLLVVLIIGGLYGGFFSPTEAGAVGAAGALLITLIRRRISKSSLISSFLDCARSSGSIFLIVIGATLFVTFIGQTGVTTKFLAYMSNLHVHRMIVLASFTLLLLVLGAFMDAIGIMLLTLPFMFPVIVKLGFDPIWFGIFQLKMLEVGFLTPPVGINVFVIKGIAPHIPLEEIFAGVTWFLIFDAITIILMTIFPGIVTWLPYTMGGT